MTIRSLSATKSLLAAASVMLAAQSASAVMNGEVISDLLYPSVRKITIARSGVCTGTFIGPRTMLTAGHCVVDAQVGSDAIDLTVDGRAPIGFKVHPKYAARDQDMQAYDVAVLEFGADANYPVTGIAGRPANEGDPVTLVGYGVVEGVAGIKRSGRSVIAQKMYGQLTLIGSAATASCTPGDSGGPLLDQNGQLVGTTGRSSEAGVMLGGQPVTISSYIELAQPEVRSFIDDAVAELNGARPRRTARSGD